MAKKEGADCAEAKGHGVRVMLASCSLSDILYCTFLSVMGRPDDLDGLSALHDLHVFSKAPQSARAGGEQDASL